MANFLTSLTVFLSIASAYVISAFVASSVSCNTEAAISATSYSVIPMYSSLLDLVVQLTVRVVAPVKHDAVTGD